MSVFNKLIRLKIKLKVMFLYTESGANRNKFMYGRMFLKVLEEVSVVLKRVLGELPGVPNWFQNILKMFQETLKTFLSQSDLSILNNLL